MFFNENFQHPNHDEAAGFCRWWWLVVVLERATANYTTSPVFCYNVYTTERWTVNLKLKLKLYNSKERRRKRWGRREEQMVRQMNVKTYQWAVRPGSSGCMEWRYVLNIQTERGLNHANLVKLVARFFNVCLVFSFQLLFALTLLFCWLKWGVV